MKIASFNRESSIDFPGKFGPVIFTPGCNFRCGYCHNPELNPREGDVLSDEMVDSFLRQLEPRVRAGWYQGATISGGEPTLQPDLIPFIGRLKKIGLAVKLDTNGTNPRVLNELLMNDFRVDGVDYVAMDIKGCRELYEKIVGREGYGNGLIENIEESMKAVSKFPSHEFRTTVVRRYHTPENVVDMVRWMGNVLGGKPKVLYLQGFKRAKKLMDESFLTEPEVHEDYLNELKKVAEPYCESVRVR